jgi:hypothetical protein
LELDVLGRQKQPVVVEANLAKGDRVAALRRFDSQGPKVLNQGSGAALVCVEILR